MLATATFQVVANFTDAEGTPLNVWTIISLVGFALSLVDLDRVEQTEKRLARIVIEQPEDLAVPIAQ